MLKKVHFLTLSSKPNKISVFFLLFPIDFFKMLNYNTIYNKV